MGYKIDYGAFGCKKTALRQKKKRFPVIWILLGFVLIFAFLNWNNFKQFVQDLLLPGDCEVTAIAIEAMVMDLKEGVSFSEALSVFCKEILSGAT